MSQREYVITGYYFPRIHINTTTGLVVDYSICHAVRPLLNQSEDVFEIYSSPVKTVVPYFTKLTGSFQRPGYVL